MKIIKPQEGFQEMALSTPADIAIIGGGAGGGKSFILLMEAMRNTDLSGFGGAIFRRTTAMIRNVGGLWDASMKMYPFNQGKPRESTLSWRFSSGATLKFNHIEYEKNLLDHQGTEYAFIGFDELTHFTKQMFFYMMSRNRSDCGVKPYIRATCNPDPDSWVAEFIAWWIDQETGFPIKERAGVLRYMIQDGDNLIWGNTRQEVIDQAPHIFENELILETGVNVKDLIKSVTFIPGNIYDNKLFINKDPGYLGNLLSLPAAEKAMLLDGNWKIRLDGLGLFDYDAVNNLFDFATAPDVPAEKPRRCITCDPARFGRDLCVILVWKGWEVIWMTIYKQSDDHDIVGEIERLRNKFNVLKEDVVVDQDGVGLGAVKLGQYTGFRGNDPARKDPDALIAGRENYKNLKTQCYYRFADKRVNGTGVRIRLTEGTCLIYDHSKGQGRFTTRLKLGGEVKSVIDLVKADLRAIKRAKIDMEGKLHINSKEEQKVILGERSPDFGDPLMMREFLELKRKRKTMTKVN